MRVLVVGTVPPPGGAAAAALAEEAARHIAAGDEVEVASPNALSAAHQNRRLDGLYLAVFLLRASRRFDAVVLRFEAGMPLSSAASRVERSYCLFAIGAALRRFGEVTIRLDSPVPIPGGVGGRATSPLWSAATRVVVANSEDAAMLRRIPGFDRHRIEVDDLADRTPPPPTPWPPAEERELSRHVQDAVRARARRDREIERARADLGVALGIPPAPALTGAVPAESGLRDVADYVARRVLRRLRAALRS